MLLPYMNSGVVEAGCDEAGRGCLAGAVYAAAVILPPDFRNELLNDSKQLSEKQRYALRPLIEEAALAWAVGVVTPQEIDRINILNASFLAMHRAIETYRDDYMNELHEKYPMYDWKSNKGYPTKAHRAAIAQYGPSPYHRLSFQLLERQLSIF